jgi:hypothetical protein
MLNSGRVYIQSTVPAYVLYLSYTKLQDENISADKTESRSVEFFRVPLSTT